MQANATCANMHVMLQRDVVVEKNQEVQNQRTRPHSSLGQRSTIVGTGKPNPEPSSLHAVGKNWPTVHVCRSISCSSTCSSATMIKACIRSAAPCNGTTPFRAISLSSHHSVSQPRHSTSALSSGTVSSCLPFWSHGVSVSRGCSQLPQLPSPKPISPILASLHEKYVSTQICTQLQFYVCLRSEYCATPSARGCCHSSSTGSRHQV